MALSLHIIFILLAIILLFSELFNDDFKSTFVCFEVTALDQMSKRVREAQIRYAQSMALDCALCAQIKIHVHRNNKCECP